MSTDAAAIQNSTEVRYPPGDLAIWIFILAELAVFAIFFSGYAFARLNNVELFNEYQQLLDRRSAFINTLALITSSFFVVRAVAAIREGDSRVCVRWLLAALLMGVIFLLVKSAEYAHHLGQGVTLSTNTFYMFYLSLTFFHFMHVIMGMVILAAVAWKANQGGYGLRISLLVLAFALFKGQLVGMYFMGLGQVRGFWRWPITLWLIIPGGLISTAFILAD
jgi:nitric oxide reductase NorE protein